MVPIPYISSLAFVRNARLIHISTILFQEPCFCSVVTFELLTLFINSSPLLSLSLSSRSYSWIEPYLYYQPGVLSYSYISMTLITNRMENYLKCSTNIKTNIPRPDIYVYLVTLLGRKLVHCNIFHNELLLLVCVV